MDKDIKVLTRLLTTDDGLSKCNTGELFQPRPTYFIHKFWNSDSALYMTKQGVKFSNLKLQYLHEKQNN